MEAGLSEVVCFWVEPVPRAMSSLRRYERSSGPFRTEGCAYHDASVDIGEVDFPIPEDHTTGYGRDDFPHDDPRWPKKCDRCDYVFRDEDHWQHNVNLLYGGSPDGKLYTGRRLPPGAMRDAEWYRGFRPESCGPTCDGKIIAVMLPDGTEWHPDLPATNGGPWTRSGTVPRVSCTPSILTDAYHGYLTDGVLRSC